MNREFNAAAPSRTFRGSPGRHCGACELVPCARVFFHLPLVLRLTYSRPTCHLRVRCCARGKGSGVSSIPVAAGPPHARVGPWTAQPTPTSPRSCRRRITASTSKEDRYRPPCARSAGRHSLALPRQHDGGGPPFRESVGRHCEKLRGLHEGVRGIIVFSEWIATIGRGTSKPKTSLAR